MSPTTVGATIGCAHPAAPVSPSRCPLLADYWSIVAATVMPYLPYLMVGYYKNRRGLYDPNNPRDSNALLEGWSLRAKGAELNCWEALSAYLAFSWIAHAAGADPGRLA